MRRHLKKEMATWAVLVAAALLAARAASAHEFPLQSVLNAFVRLEPDRAELIIRIPLHLLAGADFPAEANRELQLDQSDPASGRALAVIAQTIQLREDGALLVPSLAVGRLSLPSDRSFESYEEATAWIGRGTDRTTPVYADQGYFDAHLTYPIRAPSSEFTLQTSLVPEMRDHLKLYVRFLTLDGSARLFEITSVSGAVALDPRWHQAVVVFVREGFLHILSGIDHLLFLLALAVPFYRARLVTLLPIVTSFTLAHSVTLIASAYGGVPAGEWFAPLVETLIATSIVYMALENVLAADLGRRWLVTGAFGLVHGFGFAAGLTQTLQFAGSHLLLALVSFNVGIELGQVAFLMAVVPLLRLVLGRLATARLAAVVLSLLIGHQAWHWLLERADRLQRIEWPTPDGPTLVVLARLLVAVLAAGGLAWLAAREVGRRRDSALTRSMWATSRHVNPQPVRREPGRATGQGEKARG